MIQENPLLFIRKSQYNNPEDMLKIMGDTVKNIGKICHLPKGKTGMMPL